MRRSKLVARAIAVGIIAGVLSRYAGGAMWRRLPANSPLPQERRMPDGTILALEAVTYGREHHFPSSRRMMQPPGIGGQPTWFLLVPFAELFFAKPYVWESEEPDLLLWVALWGERPEVSRYFPPDSRVVVADGSGREQEVVLGYPLVGGPVSPPLFHRYGELAVWEVSAFPRRAASLRVRFLSKGSSRSFAEFTVPNPTPGPYPVWKPVALPATSRDGSTAFTLTRLVTDVPASDQPSDLPWRGAGMLAAFQVSENGRPSRSWKPVGVWASDATGNTVSCGSRGVIEAREPRLYFINDALPEDVWKLRVEFVQVGDFSPETAWALRGVPVPEFRKKTLLHQTQTLRGVTFRPRYLSRQALDANAGAPIVDVSVSELPAEYHPALVRAVDERGRDVRPDQPGLDCREGDDWRFFLHLPRDAKTVDLTFALARRRFAEFVVQPSHPGHGRSGK